jgi:hypothetical protein
MFEFHGWATIHDRASWETEEQGLFANDPDEQTIRAVRNLMCVFDGTANHVTDLRGVNGDWHLWIAGYHNHADSRVLDFYRATAEVAPGSYGVLYVHDDEVPGPDGNRWTAWVMKRGGITREDDTFLSPHIGVVEDPYP